MSTGTRIILSAFVGIIFCFGTVLALTEPPPNTIVQHPVELVEFVNNADFNETDVFVKTDRENIIIGIHRIGFIRAESSDTLTLDEVRFGSARSAMGTNAYNLHIPEDQIDDIRDAYLKTFGKELVFVGDIKD